MCEAASADSRHANHRFQGHGCSASFKEIDDAVGFRRKARERRRRYFMAGKSSYDKHAGLPIAASLGAASTPDNGKFRHRGEIASWLIIGT